MVAEEAMMLIQQHLRNMIGIAMWFFIGAIGYTLWEIFFFDVKGGSKNFFWKTGHDIMRDVGDFFGSKNAWTKHIVPKHLLRNEEKLENMIGARSAAAVSYFKKGDFASLRKQVERAQQEALDLVTLESDVRGKIRGSLNAQVRRFANNKEQENLVMAYQKNILDPLENMLEQILQYEELAKDAAARKNKQDEIRANTKIEELAKEIQDKLRDWKVTYDALKQVFTAQNSELQAALAAEEEKREKKEDAAAKRKAQEAAAAPNAAVKKKSE